MDLSIVLSKTRDLKLLHLRLISPSLVGQTIGSAKLNLYNNSGGTSYSLEITGSDLELLKTNSTILIQSSQFIGDSGLIEDGYYEVALEVIIGGIKHTSNTQTFATISELKQKFYEAFNVFDVNTNIKVVGKAQEISLILDTLEVLGENPGNSDDFWNKYKFIDSQI